MVLLAPSEPLLCSHFTHTYSDFSMPDSAQQEGEDRDWRGGSLVKRTYFVILKVRVHIPAPKPNIHPITVTPALNCEEAEGLLELAGFQPR